MVDFTHADLYLTAVPDALSYKQHGAHPQERSTALQEIVHSLRLVDESGRPTFTGTWPEQPVILDGKILDEHDLLVVAKARLDDYVEERRATEPDFAELVFESTETEGVYYYERPGHEWCIANMPLAFKDPSGGTKRWQVQKDIRGEPFTVDVMLGVRFEMA